MPKEKTLPEIFYSWEPEFAKIVLAGMLEYCKDHKRAQEKYFEGYTYERAARLLKERING